MHVVHAVDNHSLDNFEVLEVAHGRDGVPLNKDVAVGQKLEGLQGHTVGPDQPLASLDKLLLVTDLASNFDNLAEHSIVVQNLDGLLERNRPGQ